MPTCIDIPFQFRHDCWFCGEPKKHVIELPAAIDGSHPMLAVPGCGECINISHKTTRVSLWDQQRYIKKALIKRYQRHLAIGVNWTEQELRDCEFEGKALEGFRISGWKMYEIAKSRVNYQGWKLAIDGVELDHQQPPTFQFDGVSYPSLSDAIEHYCRARHLDKSFVKKIINKVGQQQFGFSIRLASIHLMSTNEMKQQVLQEL
ncbi:hypothetical protein [Paraferrimonas sp. SM1919]|uniref:hypothetical protein n=1 Tax=Paraferrimonas sp. SM1919 TaxID=2662263 RepID=UPI0013D51EB9|nr:hypothetical protein [Paraferrimonas sp. SM1919]